ncbi:MAG: hypothetical protein LBJ10_09050, partial [Clostridiales bacterium]|nr:hypothetical protein [Clostridiales bacterium]
ALFYIIPLAASLGYAAADAGDGTGSYVWAIRSRQGALGTEYYSVRLKVLVADTDEYYTAISRGLDIWAPVAVGFDKGLGANGRVIRME